MSSRASRARTNEIFAVVLAAGCVSAPAWEHPATRSFGVVTARTDGDPSTLLVVEVKTEIASAEETGP